MDTAITKRVQEIPDDARRTLEALLGLQLDPAQQVFVMAFTPQTGPDESVRQKAVASIKETWGRIDAHVASHSITADEFDAAIEEAMQHVRLRDF